MYHHWLRTGSPKRVRSLTSGLKFPNGVAPSYRVQIIGSWDQQKILIPLGPLREVHSSSRDLGPSGVAPSSSLDPELELVSGAGKREDVRVMGDHERKTSPLTTRDVIDSGEVEFAQRGLLGDILSVHADGLPETVKDSRIYMNLDTPFSGLVCGVQGSGKSHTVSCIMESALMVDRRVGSLPAPLATVVFHYDQENGSRPCEAAYLSELKEGGMQGVKDVVVLVSPNNWEQRRGVYAHLEHVRVEPLRIAESDLNAPRMLSMMGVDGSEVIPLYLHRALSILRDTPSDTFTYKGFRHQLEREAFNTTQSNMLQIRLELLESFLRGIGPDISSFLRPGKLVIIDLSDPFVDGTTAAMLFDICLGLFIGRDGLKGKLIVLDEAHKYLSASSSSRLTASICSIIRQQRHLGARVVVSTQEPTVVPATVLDLLSWIICHRFSSPNWVKHLSRHVCVDVDGKPGDGNEGRKKVVEWEDQVMVLRTGEAILFSSSSLFTPKEGEGLRTLSTGYAVIKSRQRLTKDGGMSIMATENDQSNHMGSPLEITPSLHVEVTTSTTLRMMPSGNGVAIADPATEVKVPPEFELLVTILNEMNLEEGQAVHNHLLVHRRMLDRNPPDGYLREGKNPWTRFILSAKAVGIVDVTGDGASKTLCLTAPYQTEPKATTEMKEKKDIRREHEVLISLMTRLSSLSKDRLVSQSTIGVELAKQSSTSVRSLGYKSVKELLTAAQEEGFVKLEDKAVKQERFWRLLISTST